MHDGEAVVKILMPFDLRADLRLVAVEGEAKRRILAPRARSARDHRRWAAVAAHGVDCDAWAPVHAGCPIRPRWRRFRGRYNGRMLDTCCAAASTRRNSDIPGSS